MIRVAGFLAALLAWGCASPPSPAAPPVSEEVRRILEWEKSLRVGFVWPAGKSKLEDAQLVVTADPRPSFEGDVRYEGRFFVDVDGYLMFIADERASSEDLNFGILQWYRNLRSGTFSVQYHFTFYRSFSGGSNFPDWLRDIQVLHSGVRSVTVNKAARVQGDVERLREWEKSLKAELAWLPGRSNLEEAFLTVNADTPPRINDVHFHGTCFVDADGFLNFMGDISGHSNYDNYGVMEWYRRIRTGTVTIRYHYTFFRSYSGGATWQEQVRDMDVLYSGVRTIVVKKG